jgi:hypothetical protein
MRKKGEKRLYLNSWEANLQIYRGKSQTLNDLIENEIISMVL